VLTKLVLCAGSNGAYKLIEVPFNWRHGDAFPENAFELTFPNAVDALMALAERGRKQQRVHVARPDRPPKLPENPATDPEPEDPYAGLLAKRSSQPARQSPAGPTPP
jgi:hypothetical protein